MDLWARSNPEDELPPKENNKAGGKIMTREEILREAERRGYEYEQKYRV